MSAHPGPRLRGGGGRPGRGCGRRLPARRPGAGLPSRVLRPVRALSAGPRQPCACGRGSSASPRTAAWPSWPGSLSTTSTPAGEPVVRGGGRRADHLRDGLAHAGAPGPPPARRGRARDGGRQRRGQRRHPDRPPAGGARLRHRRQRREAGPGPGAGRRARHQLPDRGLLPAYPGPDRGPRRGRHRRPRGGLGVGEELRLPGGRGPARELWRHQRPPRRAAHGAALHPPALHPGLHHGHEGRRAGRAAAPGKGRATAQGGAAPSPSRRRAAPSRPWPPATSSGSWWWCLSLWGGRT